MKVANKLEREICKSQINVEKNTDDDQLNIIYLKSINFRGAF